MKRTRTAVKETAPKEEPRPDSLRERVYQYLKDAMSAGKLRYGEFLDQDGICETLEVSKTPLRDDPPSQGRLHQSHHPQFHQERLPDHRVHRGGLPQ